MPRKPAPRDAQEAMRAILESGGIPSRSVGGRVVWTVPGSALEATYEAASGSCRGTLTVSRVEYLLTPQQAADVVSGLAGGGARAARPPRTGEGDMIG